MDLGSGSMDDLFPRMMPIGKGGDQMTQAVPVLSSADGEERQTTGWILIVTGPVKRFVKKLQ